MKAQKAPTACRIGLVWDDTTLFGQRMQGAIYRWAERHSHILMRRFDALKQPFSHVLKSVQEWHPHALALYFGDIGKAQKLRQKLPGIPFVACAYLPRPLVDSVISGSITDHLRVCQEHFRNNGVNTMGMFCVGNPAAFQICSESLWKLQPQASVLYRLISSEKLLVEPNQQDLQVVGSWLKQLPKPVGIFCPETRAGGYLLRICRRLRIKVPRQVQLVGPDDADGCLEYEPPLTSITLPGEAMGQTAMDTLMRWLNKQVPAPEFIIRVQGSTLIPRGSTGSLETGTDAAGWALNTIRSDATRGLTAKELVELSNVSVATLYKSL